MAGNYGPEIKKAMSETPADRARDKARGIKEGSAQDAKIDAQPSNRASPPGMRQGNAMPPSPNTLRMPQRGAPPPMPPTGGGLPPDLHHVGAATSIAHAILGNRGMR